MKYLMKRFAKYKYVMNQYFNTKYLSGNRSGIFDRKLQINEFLRDYHNSITYVDNENNKYSDVYIYKSSEANFVIKLIPLDKHDLHNLSNMSNEKRKEIFVSQMSTEFLLLNKTPSLIINYIYGEALEYKFRNPNIIDEPAKTYFFIMEYAPYNLHNYLLNNLQKYKDDETKFKEIAEILIFQLMFILLLLSKNRIVYHNDLHLRNILVEEHEPEHETYELDCLKFVLQNKKINFFLHDFGKADILSLDVHETRHSKLQMEQLNNNEFILTDIFNLFDNLKYFCEDVGLQKHYVQYIEPKRNAIRFAQSSMKNLRYPAYINLFVYVFQDNLSHYFNTNKLLNKPVCKPVYEELVPSAGTVLYDKEENDVCLLLIRYGLKIHIMYSNKRNNILDFEPSRFEKVKIKHKHNTTLYTI